MFPWQVFGLCRLNPTRRTSQCPFGISVILGFRTCLPLRGSSGFSPDSLLSLDVVPGAANEHKICRAACRVNQKIVRPIVLEECRESRFEVDPNRSK